MIRLLEKGQETLLHSVCTGDPFGCRIETAARAYGLGGKTAEFWIQFIQGVPCAAVCRVDGEGTLCVKAGAGGEELAHFFGAVGFRSLFAPEASTCFESPQTGLAMKWMGECTPAPHFDCPAPRQLLHLLAACGMGEESDAAAYVDLSYKLRHGILRAVGITDGRGDLQSCAMTVAESEDTAVIGGVATAPALRRKGLAGGLVAALASRLQQEGKRPYVFCAGDLEPFYQRLGFRATGRWKQAGDCSGVLPGVQ